MPIYDYECKNCMCEFEEFSKVDNRENVECIKCGHSTKILISTVAKPVVYNYFDKSLQANITGPGQLSKVCRKLGVSEVTDKHIGCSYRETKIPSIADTFFKTKAQVLNN